MAIQTIYDTGSSYQITSKYDGAVYDIAVGNDCVCSGIGDQFTPTYSSSSLDVSFSAGSEAIIGGSFFKVTSLTSITLPANSTIYLCARIDTSQQAGSTGSFQALTQAQMTSGNLNGSGTTRDMALYQVTTDTNGVTSVVDKRVIRSNSGVNKAECIEYVTTAPTSANTDGLKVAVLSSEPSTKYSGWIYFILG